MLSVLSRYPSMRTNPARCGKRLWPPCGTGWGWPELGHVGGKAQEFSVWLGLLCWGCSIHSPFCSKPTFILIIVTARTGLGHCAWGERWAPNPPLSHLQGNRGRVSFPEYLLGSSLHAVKIMRGGRLLFRHSHLFLCLWQPADISEFSHWD